MKKSDLKDGMIVETREGFKYLKLGDRLIKGCSFIPINNYKENLIYASNYKVNILDIFDIVKVYKSNTDCLSDIFNNNHLELLWERKEESIDSREVDELKNTITEIQNKLSALEKAVNEINKIIQYFGFDSRLLK